MFLTLHQRLCTTSLTYQRWHTHPRHAHIHWSLLGAIVMGVGFALNILGWQDFPYQDISVRALAVHAQSSGFDVRKSSWIGRQDNYSSLDYNGLWAGRQYVLAWAESGTHGGSTCRSQSTLASTFNQGTSCTNNAEGTCMLYVDSSNGIEKMLDGSYNDLHCIDGNIPGLIEWAYQSGSFTPSTLARLVLQYNYPNSKLQQFFNGIPSDQYFFDASPSDTEGSRDMQPIKTAVHYLAAMKSPNAQVMYEDGGNGFTRIFSYGGITYTPGSGPYNALIFTRNWMYAWLEESMFQPSAEANSRSYQSRAVSAARLLYDFGEPEMKKRAKMFLDFLFVDAGAQFSVGVNQWSGLLGRTYRSAYAGGGDTMPWYVYWGANTENGLAGDGYVSSYRISPLVEAFPQVGNSDWMLKQDSYRNNVFTTNAFSLAAGFGGADWRITMHGSSGNGYPFDIWINDFAGDLDGNACGQAGSTVNGRTVSTCGGSECYTCLGANGYLYRNNIFFENLSTPTLHFTSWQQSFDQVQGKLQPTGDFQYEYFLNNNQWNFLKEGKVGVAVWPGPGSGAIEVAIVDGSCSEDFCYSDWNSFTGANRIPPNASGFVNGKNVSVNKSNAYGRPSERIAVQTNSSSRYVSWSSNTMKVVHNGSCEYNFSNWTTNPSGCEGAGGPLGNGCGDPGASCSIGSCPGKCDSSGNQCVKDNPSCGSGGSCGNPGDTCTVGSCAGTCDASGNSCIKNDPHCGSGGSCGNPGDTCTVGSCPGKCDSSGNQCVKDNPQCGNTGTCPSSCLGEGGSGCSASLQNATELPACSSEYCGPNYAPRIYCVRCTGGATWNESNARCEGGSGDTQSPLVTSFTLASRTDADPAVFDWTVTDNQALSRAELWRAPFNASTCNATNKTACQWALTRIQSVSGTSALGQFTDTPAAGTYFYGLHAVDQAGNTGYEPSPLQVVKTGSTGNAAPNPPLLAYIGKDSGSGSCGNPGDTCTVGSCAGTCDASGNSCIKNDPHCGSGGSCGNPGDTCTVGSCPGKCDSSGNQCVKDNPQCGNVAQCADGLDNDGDGEVDLTDPGCADAQDNDETDPILACTPNQSCTYAQTCAGICSADGSYCGDADPNDNCPNYAQGPRYPRLSHTTWGGAVIDWIKRFDLIENNANNNPAYASAIKSANPDIKVVVTRDFNQGLSMEADKYSEWKVRTSTAKGSVVCPLYFYPDQGNGEPGDAYFNFTDFAPSISTEYGNMKYNQYISRWMTDATHIDLSVFDGVQTDGLWAGTPPFGPAGCNDDEDNDGDGKIDYPADPQCASPADDNEEEPIWPSNPCYDDIDLDGNGANDYVEHGEAWVDQTIHDGAIKVLQLLRQELDKKRPGLLMLINSGGPHDWGIPYTNGFLHEHFAGHFSFGYNKDVYDNWMLNGATPHTPVLTSDTIRGSPIYPQRNDFSLMRYGLSFALITGAYYDFSEYNRAGEHYWVKYYDEYDIDLGYPTGPAYEIPNSNGAWVRFFDNGAAITNGNDTSGVTVNVASVQGLPGYAGPYYRFIGGQDIAVNGTHAANNGDPFDSSHPITLAMRQALGSDTNGDYQPAVSDGIILVRQPNRAVVADIIIDNWNSGTSPGSLSPGDYYESGNAITNAMQGFTQQADPVIDMCQPDNGGTDYYTVRCSMYYDYEENPPNSGNWVLKRDPVTNEPVPSETYHSPPFATAPACAAGNPSCPKAVYTPSIGVAGQYEVWEWHGRLPHNAPLASNATYIVNHSGGADPLTRDQNVNYGKWNLLGTYHFNTGKSGNVTITTSGAHNTVMADAIKFVYKGP